MKLAVTGFFTIVATRKAPAQPVDAPSTTETLPQLLPPALSFTKSSATIQARPDITLTRDPTRALLIFETPQSQSQLASSLQPLGLVLEDYPDQCDRSFFHPQQRVVHAPTQFWIRSLNCQQEITQQTLVRLIPIVGQGLAWIGPVYKDAFARGRGAFTCAMPNVLLIKLRSGITSEEALRLSDDFGIFGVQENAHNPLGPSKFRRYRIRIDSPRTAYELRDQYLSPSWSQIVEQVKFSYLPMLSSAAMIPKDTRYRPQLGTASTPPYDGQWNMWKIKAGTNPLTCSLVNKTRMGWDISTGSPSVVIWLIDDACPEHTDLSLYSEGMDFRAPTSSGTYPRDISLMMPTDKPQGSHGTWCAGVLAAKIDSSTDPCNPVTTGTGVAGVAGGSRIFPLTVATNTPADQVGWAIDYATNHMTLPDGATAKVLSFSHGRPWITRTVLGVTTSFPEGWYDDRTFIETTLADALAAQMIICAASGNSAYDPQNTSILYPARRLGVMACGASDKNDFRWGGSCYGPELSVVAPGVDIPTTDPYFGYNNRFGETSAATPHVAGLAALLLRYKPSITSQDVKNTIEKTADKVGPYSYSEIRPNGTWNTQVGYGRINVKRALESLMSDSTPPSAPLGLQIN